MLRAANGASTHVASVLQRSLGSPSVQTSVLKRGKGCIGTATASLHTEPNFRVPSASFLLASTSRSEPAAKAQRFHDLLLKPRRQSYTTVPIRTATTSKDELQEVSAADVSSVQLNPDVTSLEGVQEKFRRLGLNANISRQITLTHPNIRQPTKAQSALIPAILSPTDVILRAHTGTGKSFGILLALLSKPRIVFRDSTSSDASVSSQGKRSKPQTGIASIVLVPSNELALQYMRWARSLFPTSSLPSLDPVIQCLVRGGVTGTDAPTSEEEMQRLKAKPPHILVGTPTRIKDILDTPAGSSLLGLDTLKTLVLDEADAVLQLPGRFPSHKQRWKHEVHKAPGLLILNEIMKRRATFSGGEKHLCAGLENRPGKRRDERRPPEHVRRNSYKAAERSSASSIDPNTGLTLAKFRSSGVQPLQLIATSATANSVMRHFFAARTGWLRPGAKDSGMSFAPQTGRWIDLTGLSGQSMVDQGIRGLFGANERARTDALIQTSLEQTPSTMPGAIQHTCVVVDEAPLSKQLSTIPLRNFEPKLARRKDGSSISGGPVSASLAEADAGDAAGDDFTVIRPEDELQEHEIDQTLIEALAFCFAAEGVDRGLALIPARWSLLKTRAALEALGVTVRLASDVTSSPSSYSAVGAASSPDSEHDTSASASASANPELFLLQTTSSRGLDIPSLSHVFLVGYASVIDAVQYVHSAGRVARIGGDPDTSATGKVVTLLRGLPHHTLIPSELQMQTGPDKPEKAISTSEAKMANVYRRLGVVPKKLDLGLLKSRATSAGADQSPSEEPEPVFSAEKADIEKLKPDQQTGGTASTSYPSASNTTGEL